MRNVSLLFLAASLLLVAWNHSPAGDKDRGDKKEPIPTFVEEDDGKTFPMEMDGKFRI